MGERVTTLLGGRWGWLAVAALAPVYLMINPIGFTGGGSDDGRYLDAARCWVAEGVMCRPDNHWATRWPALAPIAAGIALFGEGRTSIGLGTLSGWLASIALVGLLGALWFDRATGLLAAAVFASIPRVSAWATQPAVDLIELAFQLGALALATLAYRRGSALLAICAGIVAALAIQSRETSLAFCAVAALAWLTLDRDRRKPLLWAVAGLGGAMMAEMAVYAIAAGDPLARYRLSIGHVGVPSPELNSGVDTSRSPILNPDYIAGWRRPMGIEYWWPVDPWLNLFANPYIGPWLLSGLAIGIAYRPIAEPANRRAIAGILIGAGLVAAFLIYVLAVDPRPRIFLAVTAAAALVTAAGTIGFIRRGRPLVPVALLAGLFVGGAALIADLPDIHSIEPAARRWIAAYPDQIESDARTKGALTLLPEAQALPPPGRGKPFRLMLATISCTELAAGRATVIAEHRSGAGNLCLLSPTKA